MKGSLLVVSEPASWLIRKKWKSINYAARMAKVKVSDLFSRTQEDNCHCWAEERSLQTLFDLLLET
jgi:hypothetical protein